MNGATIFGSSSEFGMGVGFVSGNGATDVKKGISYAQSFCKGEGFEKATKLVDSLPIPICNLISLNLGGVLLA